MSDERSLREQARKAIVTGRLPNREPDRTWGGPGVGAECRICGRAVMQDETEFEIEFAQNPEGGTDNYHVHVRCFKLWEHERRGLRPVEVRAGAGEIERTGAPLATSAGRSKAGAAPAKRIAGITRHESASASKEGEAAARRSRLLSGSEGGKILGNGRNASDKGGAK